MMRRALVFRKPLARRAGRIAPEIELPGFDKRPTIGSGA
jgi:hypothetical protein